MLIRFEVENFRSILAPAELSMVAVDERPEVRGYPKIGGFPRAGRSHLRAQCLGEIQRARSAGLASNGSSELPAQVG